MGAFKLDLTTMDDNYSPSTVLFAENLNNSFKILSQILYGLIDGIGSFYGRGENDNNNINWDESVGRDNVASIMAGILENSLFQNSNGETLGYVKLKINNDNITASVGDTNIGQLIIKDNEVKSVVNTNSYIDVLDNNVSIVVTNSNANFTSSQISLSYKTNSFVKVEDKKISLQSNENRNVVLDENNLTITLGSGKTIVMDNDGGLTTTGNLTVGGANATVSGGRLIHSPKTSGSTNQVTSIWFEGNNTLYFN